MKKFLLLLVMVFTFGLSTVAMNAEAAKRMGSGKSLGTQRQSAPDKAPAQSTAAPAAGAGAGAAAAPKRSWMGPIAGLAAGLGLAALASHLGFGEELASMLMMGLLAVAVMVAIGWFMRRRAAAQQGLGSQAGGMQYVRADGANQGSARQGAPAYKVAMPASQNTAGGSMIGSGLALVPSSQIPADFDVAGFERNAKVNFIRLQAANDSANLDDIRQFTTPEMFAELRMELAERGASLQKTNVVSIQADVLEVDENAARYLVSVRFTGVIHDELDNTDESFSEIWHLEKQRQGNAGWVLSGIEQTA